MKNFLISNRRENSMVLEKNPLSATWSAPKSLWEQPLVLLGIAIAVIFILFIGLVLLIGTAGSGKLFSQTVAIIPIKGEISSQPSDYFSYSTDELVEQIKQMDDDPSVAAILLDIDSPGGTVVGTKQVVHQLRQTQKPVIAYIGEMGASAGYYIASATDYVICDEDSLTGSIGVISMYPDLNGLMDKLGIRMTVYKAGENKDMGSPFREPTVEEQRIFQSLLDETFQHFKRDVLAFRGDKINSSRFEQIADGRVLSGTQAQQIGLVDELGTREYAIQKAAELGEITGEPEIYQVTKPPITLFDLFSSAGYSFGAGFQNSFVASPQTMVRR